MSRPVGTKCVDRRVPCPVEDCNKTFKNGAGLKGHLRFRHKLELTDTGDLVPIIETYSQEISNQSDESEKIPANAPSDIKEMQRENLRLKLQRDNMMLKGVPPQPLPPRQPTITEKVGLGPMTESNADLKQKELLFPPNPLKEGLENLKLLKEAITPEKQGDDFLTKLMGLAAFVGFGKDEVRNAVQRFINPTQMSTKGLDLEGFPLPENVSEGTFNRVLDHKTKIEVARLEKEGKSRMADSFDSLREQLLPIFMGGILKGGGGPKISGDGDRTQRKAMICPKCGTETLVPTNLSLGQEFPCSNRECDGVFFIENESKRREPGFRPFEPEAPPSIVCTNCQQPIQIPEGSGIGATLLCPVCNQANILMSPNQPALPLEPEEV